MELTSFTIAGKKYKIIATNHGYGRMLQRKLDPYIIGSALLALGTKLERYNNCGKQIMFKDEGRNTAVIFSIENRTIVLITVLDRANKVFVRNSLKDNTLVDNFTLNYA